MKRFACLLLALAALAGPLSAENEPSAPAANPQDRLMFGAGWPDVRLRSNVWGPVDLEAKAAVGPGAQAYSGRVYLRSYAHGAFTVLLGAEGGVLSFSDVEGLSGTGSFYEPFLGAQARFSQRWSAQLDAGPAFLTANALGQSLGYQAIVLNAALYYSLF